MDRRTFEGPMDWEYQSQPPVDHSSPFAKFSQKQTTSTFSSPTKQRSTNPNPFAPEGALNGSPLKYETEPRPPHASFFNPQLQRKPSAPAFRNPAFTTPQKRFDELVISEYSPADSSPGMTDTSEMPADTPEFDREEDTRKPLATPSAGKTLFSKTLLRNHASGRGEIPRGSRDKIRKRKRLNSDKDVGSVRSRLAQDSDDLDSEFENDPGNGAKGSKGRKAASRGWFSSFLSSVSDHPSAPAILSKWLQLGVNLILTSLVLWAIFYVLFQIRSDLHHANEKARAALANERSICSENYIKNRCEPRRNRAPALDGPCNEWAACMDQDDSAIMQVQISVRNVAEIINEFVGVLTFKTWGFLISVFLAVVVANNVGFAFLRDSTLHHAPKPAEPLHSPPAVPPMLGAAAAHNPQQAYIWAPLSQTPRHVRKNFFVNDATDSEASPDFKMILPPQTPSGRRSPSKGDRGRSPSKGTRVRSPSKGY
ncbi:Di-sulfide bridge nucleocytoplasmic transport domain-containing protein [Corynascus novoguineensis]|uniref:Di-sulfide bridge nucleocytoplasmic transport domain-containing protein n=1 Tax=Corynascus novoguineensis TaxID=1126955 RepID=A0AAN7CSR8_9PEZI|nr:Di-sulfide bridge nucleocytoplasmic transport domain-containing protein [Corynascus novoguineensis]